MSVAAQTAGICTVHGLDFPIHIDTTRKVDGRSTVYHHGFPGRTSYIPKSFNCVDMKNSAAFCSFLVSEAFNPSALFGAFARHYIENDTMAENLVETERAQEPWFNGVEEAIAWHEEAAEAYKVRVIARSNPFHIKDTYDPAAWYKNSIESWAGWRERLM